MDQAQIQRYEFRRKVEELQKFRGRGTELISVYVPPDRAIAMVTGSLQSEYSQAGNIKSRQTRSHVQWALESILNKLKPYRVPPAHGLAIFVGTIPVGGDKFDTVSYVIEPLDPVPSFRYVCDSEFFLEPLVEMIDIGDKYGLIVIDRKECTIGMLKGKVIQRVHHQESNVPSKHGRGGQSAVRFERLIEQAAHEWFKRMSERANDAFLPIVGELKGILVGGPGATKEFFADQDYLHHEVQKKVLKPYLDTGYTDETGLRELVERASQNISKMASSSEKELVDRFFSEVRKPDSGLAAYGETQVRSALKMGAVDTLLVSEGLRKTRVHWKCETDATTLEKTHKGDIPVEKCVKCGGTMKRQSQVDLIREMIDEAAAYNSKVELVSTDTQEGAQLLTAFGGLGAILRYRIR
ncbi:MAG TPA: peptide chain release factor aRF-1 [Thermoplasmata archaeon]|nr:peptide chain release factor aRF-1 [Thermoplasmata archaeon]